MAGCVPDRAQLVYPTSVNSLADVEDFELLTRWREGDRRAANALFHKYFRTVFRFFDSKVGHETAEELSQASFLACVERRDNVRNTASFRAYLFVVARNHLYLHFRKQRQRGVSLSFTEQSLEDLGAGPSTLVGARAEQRLLLRALRKIPVDFQIAVELYYWEGASTREIANVLDIPEGTVRSRLARAREHLATQMRTLTDSAKLAASTEANFEQWARSLRRHEDAPA